MKKIRQSHLATCSNAQVMSQILVCRRLILLSCSHQLAFANGMPDFNASDHTAGGPKRLEAQPRTHPPFHRSVILFNEVVEVLGVATEDGGVVVPVVVLNGLGIGATLVNRNFLWEPLITNRLV